MADSTTPLTQQEDDGLLLPVLTRGELDAAEADNIARARLALLRTTRPPGLDRILTVEWMTRLHRAMFDEVWEWAGRFRTTERNLGVPAWQIQAELRTLIDDAGAWIESVRAGGMSADELSVRLSHRAVVVHPFPNGNGRWSRLLADAAARAQRTPVFTWGAGSLLRPDDTRRAYLEALRAADRELRYEPLLAFARS